MAVGKIVILVCMAIFCVQITRGQTCTMTDYPETKCLETDLDDDILEGDNLEDCKRLCLANSSCQATQFKGGECFFAFKHFKLVPSTGATLSVKNCSVSTSVGTTTSAAVSQVSTSVVTTTSAAVSQVSTSVGTTTSAAVSQVSTSVGTTTSAAVSQGRTWTYLQFSTLCLGAAALMLTGMH